MMMLMAAVPYNIAMETERSSLVLNTEELMSLVLITSNFLSA